MFAILGTELYALNATTGEARAVSLPAFTFIPKTNSYLTLSVIDGVIVLAPVQEPTQQMLENYLARTKPNAPTDALRLLTSAGWASLDGANTAINNHFFGSVPDQSHALT